MGVAQVFLLLIFVGIIGLAVKAMRRFRPTQTGSASSEYSKKTDGAYEAFTVQPARPPKYSLFLYIGGFLSLFGILGTLGAISSGKSGDFTLGIVIAALGVGSYWLGSTIDYRPRAHRSERTFRVSSSAIAVDGREFKRDDIHRLIMKNGMTGDRMLQSWGATPVFTETSGANISNIVQRSKNALVCYSLDLETGGKGFMLAGGMDETTVNGLLHDVCSVLKFSKG